MIDRYFRYLSVKKNRTWADVTCIDIFFREFKIMFLDYFGDKTMSHLCCPKT